MVSRHTEQLSWIIPLLALAGVLFAGYLSFSKIILKQCALNEGCNYILGIPTCVIGFVLFLLIFLLAVLRLRDSTVGGFKKYSRYIHWTAGIGVLFSGYYSIIDVFFPVIPGLNYQLILPSCVYGFFVFVIVFVLNAYYSKND
jgi:uncharacterized membrane protein